MTKGPWRDWNGIEAFILGSLNSVAKNLHILCQFGGLAVMNGCLWTGVFNEIGFFEFDYDRNLPKSITQLYIDVIANFSEVFFRLILLETTLLKDTGCVTVDSCVGVWKTFRKELVISGCAKVLIYIKRESLMPVTSVWLVI